MTMTAQSMAARTGLWFSIKIDSEEFVALLAADALQQLLRQSGGAVEPRNAYTRNRKVIDAVARKKFLDGYPRPIKVEAADFN